MYVQCCCAPVRSASVCLPSLRQTYQVGFKRFEAVSGGQTALACRSRETGQLDENIRVAFKFCPTRQLDGLRHVKTQCTTPILNRRTKTLKVLINLDADRPIWLYFSGKFGLVTHVHLCHEPSAAQYLRLCISSDTPPCILLPFLERPSVALLHKLASGPWCPLFGCAAGNSGTHIYMRRTRTTASVPSQKLSRPR